MKSKIATFVLYVMIVSGIGFGLWQVSEEPAKAEAGVCCKFSSDCPGTQLCYAPSGGQTACCDVNDPANCKGPNYCWDSGGN